MILCIGAADKIQVVTSAAVTVDCHASGIDTDNAATPTVTPYRKNTAISTAATTDITAAPASGHTLSVKTINVANKGGSSLTVTVQHTDGTVTVVLWSGGLSPGQTVTYVESAGWALVAATPANYSNESTAAQSPFATDTYLVGSNIQFPVAPVVGTMYRVYLDVTKTNVGTATPIFTIRTGTGVIGDTSRLVFTFGAGTLAADTGYLILDATFRSAGASAVLQGRALWVTNLTTTGLTNAVKALAPTSATFDASALAGSYIGLSYNGGASAVHTIQQVTSNLIP